MNIDATIKEKVESSPGLARNLGMEFFSTEDEKTAVARMPVDDRTVQPFGFLSGGATLALAETLAGVGSCSLVPNCICMGMNVNCNHVHAAPKGETVTGTATIIHQGKRTHVWQVEVRDSEGTLVSSISVTNYIIMK